MGLVMELGGTSLGPNFPVYGQSFSNVRITENGPAYRRVSISLSGFIEADDNYDSEAKYQALEAILNNSNTTFKLIHENPDGPDVILHNNRVVHIDGFNEPEQWRQYGGEYQISLYYLIPLGTVSDAFPIDPPSFGTYIFNKIPAWSRSFKSNAESFRDPLQSGTTVTIGINGFLIADDATLLQAAIQELTDALIDPVTGDYLSAIFTYGDFSHTCRAGEFQIDSHIPDIQVPYSFNLYYDIGSYVNLRVKRSSTRIHSNPSIKELPRCNDRSVKLMNSSSQTITWSLSVQASDLVTAREQLAIEASARIIVGGIEMPGGTEEEDENSNTASATIIKFYNTPVLANLTGT